MVFDVYLSNELTSLFEWCQFCFELNSLMVVRPSKGSALGTAITYALNQKEKLYLFLSNPKVEMTNNLAERTVKPYVINRKNFLFSDTENGAAASAAVMSIIETVKRNNLDVYGYLLYLLTVLPEWGLNPTDEQLDYVMPWNLALPAYCRQMYSEIQQKEDCTTEILNVFTRRRNDNYFLEVLIFR